MIWKRHAARIARQVADAFYGSTPRTVSRSSSSDAAAHDAAGRPGRGPWQNTHCPEFRRIPGYPSKWQAARWQRPAPLELSSPARAELAGLALPAIVRSTPAPVSHFVRTSIFRVPVRSIDEVAV